MSAVLIRMAAWYTHIEGPETDLAGWYTHPKANKWKSSSDLSIEKLISEVEMRKADLKGLEAERLKSL